jgi:spore maturation protein A
MFLAINTSSVQLLPPATLVALMGVGTNELMIPIILATLCSTIVAITAGKWFSRKNTAEVAA